jgi:hypothetical protein
MGHLHLKVKVKVYFELISCKGKSSKIAESGSILSEQACINVNSNPEASPQAQYKVEGVPKKE